MKRVFVIPGFVLLIVFKLVTWTIAADIDSLVVDENGKVGIGTASPDTELHIKGRTPQITMQPTSDEQSAGRLVFQDTAGTNIGQIVYDTTNKSLTFNVGGEYAPRMSINSSGNVGIGTTQPDTELHIKGNTPQLTMQPTSDDQSSGRLVFQDTAGLNIGQIVYDTTNKSLTFNVGGEYAPRMSIDSSGNVGIGTTDPQYKLHVVGGPIRVDSTSYSSDLLWKENIDTIVDPLQKIIQLRGVTYDWIDPSRGEGQQIGVIAQEVEEIFPEVVHTDSQGYKSVEYAKLIAPLIEAVKELKAENDKLKGRLAAIEARQEE